MGDSRLDSTRFAREVRRLDFIARRAWPILRPALRGYLGTRCRRCALPSAYAALDANGVCEACARPEIRTSIDETVAYEHLNSEIGDILGRAHGVGGTYDAVMLFSGGKDSCWLLRRLQNDFPQLRLLTLLVDNGFMSPIALENAAWAIKQFGVDFLVFKPDAGFVRKAFRLAFQQIPHQAGYSIVDAVDGQITFDTARNFAAGYGIPLVISGLGRTQVRNIFGEARIEMTEEDEQNPLVRRHGLSLAAHFSKPEMSHWFDRARWPAERVPRVISPLVAWNPPEREIVDELVAVGLLRPGSSSPLLTNNAFIPLIAVSEVARFGYNTFEVEFSSLIREGRIERDYWMNLFQMVEYSARTGRFIGPAQREALRTLDLSLSDLGLPASKVRHNGGMQS